MSDAVRAPGAGRSPACWCWPNWSSSSSWRSGSGSAGPSSPPWPRASWAGCCWRARAPGRSPSSGSAPAPAGRPARELGNAGLVAAGGLLMVLPGFIGDVIGLLCLLPGTRNLRARRPDPAGGRAAARRPAAAGAGGERPDRRGAPAPTTAARAVRQHPAGHRGRGRARPRRAPADLRSAAGRRWRTGAFRTEMCAVRAHATVTADAERPRWIAPPGPFCVVLGFSWRAYAGRGARRGARRAPLRGPPRNDARGACPSGCAAA